jgi:hypothetical protein
MKDIVNQKNLLIVAAALILIRLIILPLFDWQNNQIQSLSIKSTQLAKLQAVSAQRRYYSKQHDLIDDQTEKATLGFFDDTDKTKLTIQKRVEEIFEVNSLIIQDFTWVFDEDDEVRTLRASVRHQGDLSDVIRVLLLLAQDSKLIREVSWRQMIKNNGASSLGSSSGTTMLEFYATAQSKNRSSKPEGNDV